MDDEQRVTLWRDEELNVDARVTEDGELILAGHDVRDLSAFGISVTEYTYELTVTADDVPTVIEALGGTPREADVLDLLQAHREVIIRVGELTWLRRHGIEPELRSHAQ